jgi:hypothetical protein
MVYHIKYVIVKCNKYSYEEINTLSDIHKSLYIVREETDKIFTKTIAEII